MSKIITRSEAKELGLKRYFTGQPCAHGHVAERWTVSNRCIGCHYVKNPLRPKVRLSPEEAKRRQKENKRRYYLKNLEVHKARGKQWKKENKESLRKSWARWREKPKNKLLTFMRDALRRVLTREKSSKTEVMLGYTRQELERHIEKQFQRGMSWDNYGDWHIDHIIPIAHFLNNGIEEPAIINCLSISGQYGLMRTTRRMQKLKACYDATTTPIPTRSRRQDNRMGQDNNDTMPC